VTAVPKRVHETKILICGFCGKPFTLRPEENHYTTKEWADDGSVTVIISVCVKCAARKMVEREAEPPPHCGTDLPTITYIDTSLEQWFLEHPDDLAEEWAEQMQLSSGSELAGGLL
jgi:hypothetical protein